MRPDHGRPDGESTRRGHWIGKSATVARVQLRRILRQQVASPWKILILVFLFGLFGLFTLGGAWLAYTLGGALAAGELNVSGQLDLVRGGVATVWVGLTGMATVRAAGSRGSHEATGGLLWVTETRVIATGLALAEVVGVLLWILLPAIALSVAFALGVGSPIPVATVGLTTLLVATTSVAVGYPLGVGVRHVLTRFPFVKRYRTALVVLGFLAYFGAISTGLLNQVVAALVRPLSLTPMGWFADLALLGTPGIDTSPLRAVVAVAMLAVVVPSVIATTRVANRHWFADPVLGGSGDDEEEASQPADRVGGPRTAGRTGTSRPRFERFLARWTGRPTATLVTGAYRRAYRAPAKLLYAAMPLFFLIGYVPDILGGGGIPPFAPVLLLLIVTWGAGVAFVLNPLGDQGNVLPATILSGVSGRTFVGAHVLASLLLVVPLGIIVPGAAAVASPLDPAATLLLLAASPLVVTMGCLTGVGIGMAAPRFSSVRVSGSTQVVVPSKVAFAGYSVYLVATAVAGLLVAREGAREVVALLLTALVPVSVPARAVLAIAGVLLVVLLATPIASYRYAVRRFETVTLESAGA